MDLERVPRRLASAARHASCKQGKKRIDAKKFSFAISIAAVYGVPWGRWY
jgi:hypothetical protein